MTVTCPSCGKSGKLPPSVELGSRKIRCPSCGVRFATESMESDIGARPPVSIVLDFEPESRHPDVVTEDMKQWHASVLAKPEADVGHHSGDTRIPHTVPTVNVNVHDEDDELTTASPSAADLPSDPWFYMVLEAWGVLQLIGAGIALFVMIPVLVELVNNAKSEHAPSLLPLAPPLLVAFVLVSSAAVMFLIVDVARNIRATRFHAERAEALLKTRLSSNA
jgi:hypothetical protein